MSDKVAITKDLLDDLADSISEKSGVSTPMTIPQMKTAVDGIVIPTITLNGSATTTPDFYAPTTAGTANYFLKSSGSGAPTWSQPVKYGSTLPASGDFTGQVFILIE